MLFPNFSKSHQPDYIFIITLFILIIFGLIALSSASTVISYQKFQDSYYFLKHQILFGLIPGLVFFFLALKINLNQLKKYSPILLIISILLLIAVLIPELGVNYGKARSWINIAGISFQPSELIKLFLILFLATWFEKKGEKIKSFSQSVLPFLFLLGIICFLIILQPDMGTMSVIVSIALMIFFVTNAKLQHFLLIILSGIGLLILLIKATPYRLARLTVFLNPTLDPLGIGYHINQAFLAIGSGGILGLGLGHSQQKFQYLPEVIGDSIFAIIAEELGFILSTGLIILFLILIFRGFKIAQNAPNEFTKLTAFGIISWFGFQAFINIAAMLGLAPITGIPLPFISYGGTSLAISLAAAGILINISKYTR
ncbi:putative lipid II flippase FtsW [Candidatus Kuenenbacteria bacterium HGW-Kuenenbacteria-1]|uniref:Probable peptidoglycan glycosyltransferase FtsW n=1 Tax=Candidatus Kuenenbacteria bacterium HGW-Kuenenbacteria-1 TaxID=2013812 RepID=A0A2N1UNE5_9BACT|nr:MAG: putative lipid II flippase FtsW [Candidatus Kuenenbacteria bacterium HGW-Kuenenbacteria-1]